MNSIRYELAAARRDDLLRQAADHRLAHQTWPSPPLAPNRTLALKRRGIARVQRLRAAIGR